MGCFGGDDPQKPQYIAAQLEKLSLPDRLKALDDFIAQKDKFSGIQGTLESSASGYMDSLDRLNPGYKAGFAKLQQLKEDATDDQLIAQLKREASAITYAAEIGHEDGTDWSY